jgi:TatD DNase family protein
VIDIGVNLTHRSFDSDRDEVIERAQDAGVEALILTGTSLESSERSVQLTDLCPSYLYTTVGVHPHESGRMAPDTLPQLRSLAGHPAVVAIGECGLDFNRDFSPRPAQEACFRAQLELAVDLNLPVFLHARDAHGRFIAILKDYMADLRGAVLHCFTGTANELHECLDQGLHIGITGWICDERRGTHLRSLVKTIPMNRLMLETDAPFLTPRDLRPKPKRGRNEPSFLPHICRAVATYAGIDSQTLAAHTVHTTRQFFELTSA